jgi:hypothetical protein
VDRFRTQSVSSASSSELPGDRVAIIARWLALGCRRRRFIEATNASSAASAGHSMSPACLQNVGGDLTAALGVALHRSLGVPRSLCRVGSEAVRNSFAKLANLRPSAADRSVPRLGVDRLVDFLPALGE